MLSWSLRCLKALNMAVIKRLFSVWTGILGCSWLLLVPPLHATIHVSSGLYQASTLSPGTTEQQLLIIENSGEQAQTVILYQKDEVFAQDDSGFLQVGSHQRSNAAWIEFETDRVMVPAHTSLAVPFQVIVPADASLYGSYWSVVMVQAVALDPAGIAPRVRGGLSVQQTFRTAVRMVTHLVTQPLPNPVLSFEHSDIRRHNEGTLELQIVLANPGVLGLYLRVFAEVIDQQGQSVGRFSPRYDQVRLLPTSQAHRSIQFPDLAAGQYQIIVVAENHDGQLFGARMGLTVGAQ